VSDQTAPTAMVRRLGREYGWLLAAAGLAALVLACSIPFVTGVGMSWNSGDPFAAPVRVAPAAGGTTSGVPETAAGPSTSPSPSASVSPTRERAKPPVTRRPTTRSSSPTPPRTTPPAAAKAPVALGPDGGAMGLWMMLREYCRSAHNTREAQLRHGTGQAENNWECRRQGEDPLIDMTAACRRQYGSVAFAQFSNRNDAFSWHCFRR